MKPRYRWNGKCWVLKLIYRRAKGASNVQQGPAVLR